MDLLALNLTSATNDKSGPVSSLFPPFLLTLLACFSFRPLDEKRNMHVLSTFNWRNPCMAQERYFVYLETASQAKTDHKQFYHMLKKGTGRNWFSDTAL
ncbi:hypothetical protein E2C01_064680 [Portunus trituberculatus]|uniref:Uncharacterized protein n=1 Tax=Portunus trituberculatus TaxID=210409 RepID=A0A5B7HCG8_PORTR|nr:hypothetical protein [Portunus trituberculatus]